MSRTKILLTFLFCLATQMLMAQSRVISGTVEDSMGPIMMANVTERDANNRIVSAVQTDMMGNFSMEIKNPKNKLVISYVGSKTKTITIGDQTTFDIKLEDEKTTLTEVTVKGRRSNSGGLNIDKKEITVSTQTFDLSDVEGMAFTSADEALQGEIAGLDIVSNSGNLGSGTTMRLNGITSINGNAEPLIVVDDKIFDNPDETFDFENANEEDYSSLLSVNVDDIAKIEVLKDAAATAVWGSKGANGVISITTKRGTRGKPRVAFSYKFTGTWMPEGYDLLNGDDYTMMLKEAYYNPNQSSKGTANIREINYDKSWGHYEDWNNNTDWVDEVSQFGAMQSWNLNVTGGGQKAQFRISGGYDHQTGTIIKQELDRLSTRLVLDYTVSDRIKFSTNFALTYTNNLQNYTDLLGKAQLAAPNMSIYSQESNGADYYIVGPTGDDVRSSNRNGIDAAGNRYHITPYTDPNYSSYEMRAIRDVGNPIAWANLAWKKDQTYRITPDFQLKYELLGLGSDQHRLTFTGTVDFDIYARSTPSYCPVSVQSVRWNDASYYNVSGNSESNRLKTHATAQLAFTPYFKNEDVFLTMLAKYEMTTSRSNSQTVSQYSLPDGITSVTAIGALANLSSGSSRSNYHNWLYNAHFSYKGRYNFGFSLRADGDSKYGPEQKWAYFPGLSGRYNISDEAFFKPIRKYVNMLGLRASWGRNGNPPGKDYLFYNSYTTGSSIYGTTASMSGLKMDDLTGEVTTSSGLGLNLGLFDDKVTVELDYYYKSTTDMLMGGVKIPASVGYGSLAYANVGKMTNEGWYVNVTAKNLVKIGKFSFGAGFNLAQNYNEIKEMEERVLSSINTEWAATRRGYSNASNTSFLNRIQTGNPLGSIYGFRYKGVYQYSYNYLTDYNIAMQRKAAAEGGSWSTADFENWINGMIANGKTIPVVIGTDGKVIMAANGLPQQMVYNYVNTEKEGSSTYTFQGGDAIYEDINHDGQINSLDIVYLGNCNPKVNGGFNFSVNYGQWSLKARFNFRYGNKVINAARMNLESMSTAYNQCSTVNWRWRQDGDDTMIPRAMYVYNDKSSYNYQGSDRYVEDGSFLRFQNLQLSYNFPKKLIKKWGLNNLQLYGSMNNLFCWTRYSGVDPEIPQGSWGLAVDTSKTPRSKQFTATINVGF